MLFSEFCSWARLATGLWRLSAGKIAKPKLLTFRKLHYVAPLVLIPRCLITTYWQSEKTCLLQSVPAKLGHRKLELAFINGKTLVIPGHTSMLQIVSSQFSWLQFCYSFLFPRIFCWGVARNITTPSCSFLACEDGGAHEESDLLQ